MKKTRPTTSMKRLLLTTASLGLLTMSCVAQTNHSIGTGTTAGSNWEYPSPLADYYESSRQQFLYTAAEATAAGMAAGNITAIKWTVTAVNNTDPIEQFTIKMGTTSATSLSTTGWESVSATVYSVSSYQPVAGVNTFTFSAPFVWNGTSNIVVEICGGDPNNATGDYYSYNASVAYSVVSFNGSRTLSYDDLGNVCGSTSTLGYHQNQNRRPNITFVMGSAPCNAPTGVAISAKTTTSAMASWTAPAGVITFQYIVDKNAASPTAAGTAVTGTTRALNSLSPATAYYLHVRTACAGGTYSTWVNTPFTTDTCKTPANLTVSNISATGATVGWAAITGVSGYEYAVTTLATPPASGAAVTSPTASATSLKSNTNYYAHVRSKCGTDYSIWATKPFSTSKSTGIANKDIRTGLVTVFPNPSSGSITVQRIGNEPGQLVITDLSGRILRSQQLTDEINKIDLSEVHNGLYLIRYNNGQGAENIKLEILK